MNRMTFVSIAALAFTVSHVTLVADANANATSEGNVTEQDFHRLVTERDALGYRGDDAIGGSIEVVQPETDAMGNPVPLAGTDPYSDPVGIDAGLGTAPVTGVPGESIDVRTGELTLTATDLVVPGNGGMDIVVSRTRSKTFFESRALTYGVDRATQGFIGDWELDLPYIEIGSVDAFVHKRNSQIYPFVQSPLLYNTAELGTGDFKTDRSACMSPYTPNPKTSWNEAHNPIWANDDGFQPMMEFFDGLSIAGFPGGQRELLFQNPGTRISQNHWTTRCETSGHDAVRRTDGGTTSAKWVAYAPDGTKYYFDEPARGSHWKALWEGRPEKVFGRMRVYISRIVDTNGNAINFEYDNSLAPNLLDQGLGPRLDLREHAFLKRIWAEDGREVNFEWECNPFAIGGGTSDCPSKDPASSDPGTQAAPLYRLKGFSFEGKQWTFHYNDTETGARKSRFLTRVGIPGGLSWEYSVSTGTAFDTQCSVKGLVFPGQSHNYSVTHPQGAFVAYTMETKRFARATENGTTCSVGSAVTQRVVDDLQGSADTTKWCYEPYRAGDTNSQWVHVYEPSRFQAFEFVRERNDKDQDWREGLLLKQVTYARRAPPSGCSTSIDDPGTGGLLRSAVLKHEHSDVAILYQPESSADSNWTHWFLTRPDYPKPLRTRSWDAGHTITDNSVGTFDRDVLRVSPIGRPIMTRESNPFAPARYTLTTYTSRAGKLGLVETQCLVSSETATTCPTLSGVVQGTVNSYDDFGNLVRTEQFGTPTSFSLHADGEVHVATDARNKQTTFQNYRRGVPQYIRHPDSVTETLVVNDDGSISSVTARNGQTTTYQYDDASRLDLVQFPLGADLDLEWSEDGRTRTTTRGRLRVETRFDGFGRRIAEISTDTLRGESVARSWTYDADGRVAFESYPESSLDAANHGFEFTFDTVGRPETTRRTVDGKVASIVYRSGEYKDSYDFKGNKVTSQFRSFGAPSYAELLKVESHYTPRNAQTGLPGTPTKFITTFVRDEYGFATSVAQDTVTRRYQPNARRFVMSEYAPELEPNTLPGTNNISYCRDESGLITGKSINATCTDPALANLVHVQYDDLGRVLNETYNDNGVSPSRELSYTELGQVDVVSKGATINDADYDVMGGLESQTLSIEGFAFKTSYSRTRNGTDNPLRHVESITYPSGRRYDLTPDAWGRPTRISGILSSVTYHPTGTPHRLSYANGQVTTTELTERNEVDSMTTLKGGSLAMSLDYLYDDNGNVENVANTLNSDLSQAFTYDELNRVVATGYPLVPNGPTYYRAYNGAGNVVLDQQPGRSVSFAYDTSRNRLASYSKVENGATTSSSVGYDGLGNISARGNVALTFGHDGNLNTGTVNQTSIEKSFVYDGTNHIVKESGPDGLKYLVYSGENLLMEFNPEADTFTEYVYLGSQLVGSRKVEHASRSDSDGDGFMDTQEFRGLGR